jgi:hypothetical protein
VAVVKSIIRMYFYACASLLVCFVLSFFFEPLKVVGSLTLRTITPELSPVLSTFAYGFVAATLSLFAWNFLLGSVVAQTVSGLFGVDAPQIILVGRATIVGLIYGATYESIAHTLKYDMVNVTLLIIVVLTEFLAYSIATYGGVRIGKSVGKLDDGTRLQRIVNSLVGPLPFTYSKVKHEIRREMRSAVKLFPIITAILLFSATLEIWLVKGDTKICFSSLIYPKQVRF